MQCDKYYECDDGIATERLCPDGLVFDETIRLKNKCDQPFNVDCGDRTELRKFDFFRNILSSYYAIVKLLLLLLLKLQNRREEQMKNAHVKTDSLLIQTPPFAIFSLIASMAMPLK